MQLKYRREVDGLRALAVLPVLLFHAGVPGFGGGYVGVDVFFVISGYLITSILATELSTGRYSLLTFYERRARRILPALVFVLLVTGILEWLWLAPRHLNDFARSATSVATFSSNLFFWRESGYFDSANDTKALLHTWSLAIEEQYYLFFPPLLALVWRRFRPLVGWLVAAIAVASLVGSVLWGPTHAVANFYLLPSRAWELMLGALVALTPALQERAMGDTVRKGDGWLAALGLGTLTASVLLFDAHTAVPGLPALLPTVGTALILTCAHPQTRVARLLSLRPVVWVGLVSYSAYLWHQPLLAIARAYQPSPLGLLVRVGLCVLAIGLAWLSWRYVEAPFRDKNRFSRVQILTGAAGALVAIACAGLYVAHTRGFASRYPQLSSGWSATRDACAFPTEGLERLTCTPQIEVARRDGRERRILFVGDSLLMAMSEGIRAAATRTGIPVNIAAHSGCPILADATARMEDGSGNPDCWTYNAQWEDFAVRHGITDIVLVSAYNRYFRRGTAMTHSVSMAPAEALSSAFALTARRLREHGMSVAFARQLPDFGVQATEDVNDRVFAQLRAHKPVQVGLAREVYDADSAAFLAAVAAAGADVVDLSSEFCDAQSCSPLFDGRCMYADNDHPGHEGDAYLTRFWAAYLVGRTTSPIP